MKAAGAPSAAAQTPKPMGTTNQLEPSRVCQFGFSRESDQNTASAASSTMLRWSSLNQGLASAQITSAIFNTGIFADFYKACFYAAAGIILCFLAINLALTGLTRYHSASRKLSFPKDAPRVVFTTHVAFCLIFTATFVPYSIALVRVLFSQRSVLSLGQPSTYRCIAYPLALQLMMYVFEGALRSVYRINLFLIIHHLMFCSMLALMLESSSTFVLKVDVILSCFATYEMLLYASLIARRVSRSAVLVKSIMAAGLAFYAFTRLVQAALLIGLFVATYGQESKSSNGRGLWWTSLIMCTLLGLLQCYTFVIYSAIWRRIGQPQLPRHMPSTASQASSTSPAPLPFKDESVNGTEPPSSVKPHEASDIDILSSRADFLPRYKSEILNTDMSNMSSSLRSRDVSTKQ